MRRPGDDQRDDGPPRRRPRDRLVADLAARRARSKLRPGEVRPVAARLGVGKRTLWRWIAAGRQPQRHGSTPRRFVLTPELRNAICGGAVNVAAVWRETREYGRDRPRCGRCR